MRLGYFSLNTAEGIAPAVLASELEDRGFDRSGFQSSHIPVVRAPGPFGEDVPDGYVHLMDPIGFGANGEVGMRYAAQLADEWYPIRRIVGRLWWAGSGNREVPPHGRRRRPRPHVRSDHRLCLGLGTRKHPSTDLVASYEQFGVERVVLCPSSNARHSTDVTRRRLDEFASLITRR